MVNSNVFLKLETNHEIFGWAGLKGVDPRVSKPMGESLFEPIEGEHPTRIQYIWQKI